jgi:hypothetical protein
MTARGTVASFARPRTRALFASAVPVTRRPVTHAHTPAGPSQSIRSDALSGSRFGQSTRIPRPTRRGLAHIFAFAHFALARALQVVRFFFCHVPLQNFSATSVPLQNVSATSLPLQTITNQSENVDFIHSVTTNCFSVALKRSPRFKQKVGSATTWLSP